MLRANARDFVAQYDREEAWEAFCSYAAGFYCSARYGVRGPTLDPTVTSETAYTERAAQIFNEYCDEAFDVAATARAIASQVVHSEAEYDARLADALQHADENIKQAARQLQPRRVKS
jgi:hypothetical protein